MPQNWTTSFRRETKVSFSSTVWLGNTYLYKHIYYMIVMNVLTYELNYEFFLFVGRKRSGAQSPPKQCDLKTNCTGLRNRNDSRVTL